MIRMLMALALSSLLSTAASTSEVRPAWLTLASSLAPPATATDDFDFTPERLKEIESDGHPYVERLLNARVQLTAEGQVVEQFIVARHLMTPDGVRSGGTLRRTVRSESTAVHVESAFVSMPDGRRVPFDPATLQIVENPDPDVFSDAHDLVFPFSGLVPGATVVLSVRKTLTLDTWPLPWSQIYFPQRGVPVETFEVVVDREAGAPEIVWSSDDPQMSCQAPTALQVRCRRHLVPAIQGDPNVNWFDALPHLVIAEKTSWKELAHRENELVRSTIDAAELRAAAQEIIGGSRGRSALRRLYRFVTDDIRYVAFEHGTSAVVPHSPSETLARRFGDCKDKVALFLGLAEGAGFRASPVLVASSRYRTDRLLAPSWTYFDHMIACVGSKGQRICLEFTDPSLGFGTLPLALEGAVSLDLSAPDPKPEPLKEPPHGWVLDVRVQNHLRCDGIYEQKVTRKFRGPGAAAYRGALQALSHDDRQEWLEADFEDVMGDGATELSIDLKGLTLPSSGIQLISTAQYGPIAGLDEQEQIYEVDAWLLNVGLSMRTGNEQHPFRSVGLRLESVNEFRVCASREIRYVGAHLDLQSEFGKLEREYELGHLGMVVARTVLEIPRQVVAPGKLAGFNRFIERALAETNLLVGLAPAEGQP